MNLAKKNVLNTNKNEFHDSNGSLLHVKENYIFTNR